VLYDFMANYCIYFQLFKRQYKSTKLEIKKMLTKVKLFV